MNNNLLALKRSLDRERLLAIENGGDRAIPPESIRLRSPDGRIVDLSAPLTSSDFSDRPDPAADEAMMAKDPQPYVLGFGRRLKFTDEWHRSRTRRENPAVITLDLTRRSWRLLCRKLRSFAQKAKRESVEETGKEE